MVRKIFFILIPFFFFACASKPAPDPVINPEIKIDLSKQDMASISLIYTAENWAFINAVELKNAAGEIKKYTFKDVRRDVFKRGVIFEGAVISLFNADDPYIKITDADKLRAFIGGGEITARPLADRRTFAFGPVDVKY